MNATKPPIDLTKLLREWRNTTHLRKHEAGGPLFTLLYEDLVKIASNVNFSKAVEPRDLVHQLFVKWQSDAALKDWKNRAEFFRVAKAALRNLVLDRYRQGRRFSGSDHLVQIAAAETGDLEILRFLDALTAIGKDNPLWEEVLMMKYLEPATNSAIASAMGVSESTVKRLYQNADKELRRQLGLPEK
jgi:RNA polymerase sigma factor (sigma-70 family)